MGSIRKAARRLVLKWRNPSRHFLEQKIFPKIKNKKILYVGCDNYTVDYPKRLKKNNLWTLDIRPSVKKYGAKNHVVGDIRKVDNFFEKDFFDIVFFVGIFGYGINNNASAEKAIRAMSKTLKKNGLLIIQWTNRRGKNLVNTENLKEKNKFNEGPLFKTPTKTQIGDRGYIWEFWRKK
jgi:SAM-dependent methyltransferase